MQDQNLPLATADTHYPLEVRGLSSPLLELARADGKGGEGGVIGTVRRMDAAIEPYLIGIWQRRCREPAWAAV
ncbi:hypothetical protein DM611_17955 [Stenotrophomonas maltophilia]|nr:hypothetical protein DM611_17955 [Stenotrophomonas maltophilia]